MFILSTPLFPNFLQDHSATFRQLAIREKRIYMFYLVCIYLVLLSVTTFHENYTVINMFIPSTPLFPSLQNHSATFRQLAIRETIQSVDNYNANLSVSHIPTLYTWSW